MLKIVGFSSGYDKRMVIRNISIEIYPGEIVAIIGRNGMGKTTLVKSIMGLVKPSTGDIYLRNRRITHCPTHKRAHSGIGYIPQGRGLFPKLTVEENLIVGELINCQNRSSRKILLDAVYGYFPRLLERRRQRAETMSGGEQSMLSIARGLVGQPNLLLLDEPSEGVQPNVVSQIGKIIAQINREISLTVLLVEQNLSLIQHIAHRCYVMDKGCIIASLGESELEGEQELVKHLSV